MNTAYPTIRQSIGIIGTLIVCMLLACPLLFTESLIGKEATFFSYYVVSMGLGVFLILSRRKKQTTEPAFRFEIDDVAIVPFLMVATLALQYGVTAPITSLIPIPDSFKSFFLEFADRTGFFSFLAIVVAAPILEEMIFRGIILDGFLKRYSPIKSILFSSFLFGFIHLNPWQFIAAGLIGILTGWVYYRTRSISLAIIIHMTNNLSAFLSMRMSDITIETIDESLVETYGSVTMMVTVTALMIFVLIACVYYLKQKFPADPVILFAYTEPSVTEEISVKTENAMPLESPLDKDAS